jgi:transposase
MLSVEEREQIRRAYYIDGKSMRQIAREQRRSRKTVKKAIESAEAEYRMSKARDCPVLGPYMERIEELLRENEGLPAKQQYTAKRMHEIIRDEGYRGSESAVRRHVGERRRERKQRAVYLPLGYDPGADAQVDWGEGQVILNGEMETVQLWVMRLCYSRRIFVQAYPTERQECFMEGHVLAFHHFGGVPRRLTYDNLKTAVHAILSGRNRQEQRAFTAFRSHYLFESYYCTPGQGHEKGGVEHGVGYARRNFLVPLPEVSSYAELNTYLLEQCLADDARTVDRQTQTIGQAWAQEQPYLLPLPEWDYTCCVTREVKLNPYSQVVFETNRYSVPTDQAFPHLTLKAYPFEVEIIYQGELLARHPRCYQRNQDVLDPLHYLPLLHQRPGAFDYAQPLREWREGWPAVYEQLLAELQQRDEGDQAIRQFLEVLALHRTYPAEVIEQAIELALTYGCLHADGVQLCAHQLVTDQRPPDPLDLASRPHLAQVGKEPLELHRYNRLLSGGFDGD